MCLVDFEPDGLKICRTTPANIQGQHLAGANVCRQIGGGITGTFNVIDRTCRRHPEKPRKGNIVAVTEDRVPDQLPDQGKPNIEEVGAVSEEVGAPVGKPHWGRFRLLGCAHHRRGCRRWTAPLKDIRGGWNTTSPEEAFQIEVDEAVENLDTVSFAKNLEAVNVGAAEAPKYRWDRTVHNTRLVLALGSRSAWAALV